MDVVEESVSDVDSLHSKLERKNQVEKHNETVKDAFKVDFKEQLEKIQNRLQAFRAKEEASLGEVKAVVGKLKYSLVLKNNLKSLYSFFNLLDENYCHL